MKATVRLLVATLVLAGSFALAAAADLTTSTQGFADGGAPMPTCDPFAKRCTK